MLEGDTYLVRCQVTQCENFFLGKNNYTVQENDSLFLRVQNYIMKSGRFVK